MAQQTTTFDPKQQYEVKVFDIEYRKVGGRELLARIYQPQGAGLFPALLDVHGGAWSAGDRTTGEIRGNSLASSGMLVAAIDLRIAPEHPYPSQLEDTNYGARWRRWLDAPP